MFEEHIDVDIILGNRILQVLCKAEVDEAHAFGESVSKADVDKSKDHSGDVAAAA